MIATDAEILQILTSWLPQRRWFAGKGHRVTGLRMAARHRLSEVDGAEHLIVNVSLEDAAPQTYQVPVLTSDQMDPASLIGRTRAGFVHDGTFHSLVMQGMLAANDSTAGEDCDEKSTSLTPEHNDRAGPQCHWLRPPPQASDYRALAVEQSNTSGVLGDSTFVKLFRLLAPGLNPDIEVHGRLQEVGCGDVGSLHGRVSGSWREPATDQMVHGDLVMMLDYFPNSIDGWVLAGQGEDFTLEARELGQTTARVHRDLRRAFATKTLGSTGTAAISRRLNDRLSVAARLVPQVDAIRKPLEMLVRGPEALDHMEVQRIHGDLHLGQVLRTPGGWRIIDFESEPGGPLDQRTALDHPMRDVAGMIRSFAYAAARGGPARWRQECTSAFLEGYAQAGGIVDDSLLLAYLVDKAAYEAVYETRNRPEWVDIPLAGLRELAATLGQD